MYYLKVGEVSGVLSADGKHHLFKVLRREAPIPFDVVNRVMDKKTLRDLVDYVYRNLGPKATVILSDRLKNTGYRYSTEGGLSISIDAMITPDSKWEILSEAERQVEEISRYVDAKK
ncbi:MAG: hypothetical protein P8Y40_00665, partial [Desulfobacterales bacterium]